MLISGKGVVLLFLDRKKFYKTCFVTLETSRLCPGVLRPGRGFNDMPETA